PVDGRDGLGFVRGPVGIAHTHAAESHRGDGQTLLAESSRLHAVPPREACSLRPYFLAERRPRDPGPRPGALEGALDTDGCSYAKKKWWFRSGQARLTPGPPATDGLLGIRLRYE